MSARTCGTVVSLLLQAMCVASGPVQVNCTCPVDLVVQLCLFYCRLCVASGPGQVNFTCLLELVVQLCLFYCRLCVLPLVLDK